MKKNLLLLLFILVTGIVQGQDEKRDYIWLFGYDSFSGDSTFGGTIMDFNYDPPKITYESRSMNFFDTNASISDENGQLLCYTNGRFIANSNNDTIPNSTNINPGTWSQSYGDNGLSLYQGALILPQPDQNYVYYLFHEEREFTGGINLTKVPHLLYSKINTAVNGGEGLVTELNTILVKDTLDYGKIIAVRHGNGRDWWIMIGEFNSNKYYRFLLNPSGILNPELQIIGDSVPSGLGQANFSPDGSKHARMNGISNTDGAFLDIYDFDRCSGLLSNHYRIKYQSSFGSQGVAFSPNSRFIYVPAGQLVFQYDLWESDIAGSVDTVAIYDGFQSPFHTTFYLAQLGPDGKIYINCPNGVDVLHVIHKPDEKGIDCQFEQHGIKLAALNAFSLPNFPNFRLGALEGSPCDTLETVAVDEPDIENDIAIFPNPAQDRLTITTGEISLPLTLHLYDALGRKLVYLKIYEAKTEIDLGGLVSGSYWYNVRKEDEAVKSGRLVIIK